MDAASVALAAAPRGSGPAYTSVEVCRLAGVTYRQLDYWCRQGVVAPATPNGRDRLFSEHDLVAVAACARLADLGAGTPAMTRLAEALADVDLASLPRVAAVDADGHVRFGPGLDAEELRSSWLVLVAHPGQR